MIPYQTTFYLSIELLNTRYNNIDNVTYVVIFTSQFNILYYCLHCEKCFFNGKYGTYDQCYTKFNGLLP